MQVLTSTISFRIDVDFDDCDVDMVYDEMRASGVQTPINPALMKDAKPHKVKGDKTPKAGSVDFALHWLAGYVDRRNMCTTNGKWDKDYGADWITVTDKSGFTYATKPEVKTELEELGVSVKSWYGLMMGTCHLVCEVDFEKFSPELVGKCQDVVKTIFKKFVRYYKQQRVA